MRHASSAGRAGFVPFGVHALSLRPRIARSSGGALPQGSSSAGTGTEAADEQSRRCDDRMSMLLLLADRNRAARDPPHQKTSEADREVAGLRPPP